MKNNRVEMIILGLMCFMLSIAIYVQIKTVNSNGSTVGLEQSTSNLKTQVLKMKEKYERQYNDLEKAEKELGKIREEVTQNNGELEDLKNKIKEYDMLIGNTNVQGEGIEITLTDGKEEQQTLEVTNLIVHAENVLSVVNELKNAGSEAISINGKRLVNISAISCDGNVIVVNGEKISSPIEISAIGLPELLSTLDRPGGTLSYFEDLGKIVTLKKHQKVQIQKYTGVFNYKYARTIK